MSNREPDDDIIIIPIKPVWAGYVWGHFSRIERLVVTCSDVFRGWATCSALCCVENTKSCC